MATSLYMITNAKLTGKETQKDWQRIVAELQNLQMDTISYFNADNEYIQQKGHWEYQIESEIDRKLPFCVDFYGPYYITPRLYTNIGILDTIYRYELLYRIYNSDWFDEFRTDIYNIITIIGGTEVIYLADNACYKLATYLERMAWENVPYEDIKMKMIEELGAPVREYSQLNYDTLSYSNIKEFFLDDFRDLKNKEL